MGIWKSYIQYQKILNYFFIKGHRKCMIFFSLLFKYLVRTFYWEYNTNVQICILSANHWSFPDLTTVILFVVSFIVLLPTSTNVRRHILYFFLFCCSVCLTPVMLTSVVTAKNQCFAFEQNPQRAMDLFGLLKNKQTVVVINKFRRYFAEVHVTLR